jgi:iron-sulfur cluster repair protein YtfE (RIC family)
MENTEIKTLSKGEAVAEIHNIDNPVLKISNEHKIISDYAARFSKNRIKPDPAIEKDLPTFLNFLKKDLTRHFRLEELIFYPAALNGDPSYATCLMVLNLTREHGILETRLKAIQAVEKRMDEPKDRKVLLEKLSIFFEDLKDHARREITELFPLMDANRQCTALLKQYADEVKSRKEKE